MAASSHGNGWLCSAAPPLAAGADASIAVAEVDLADVPPRCVDVLAAVILGEPCRPPSRPGIAREVRGAARLQRRKGRVIVRPEQEADAAQLGAVLEPRVGELEPLPAAEEEDDGEAELPRGEARCDLEAEGIGAVAVVQDGGPRLPGVPGEVELEVVPAEAARFSWGLPEEWGRGSRSEIAGGARVTEAGACAEGDIGADADARFGNTGRGRAGGRTVHHAILWTPTLKT
jgi:hypothetical protein